MFHTIQTALADEALERVVLLLNHVLAGEPAAAQRLRAHVGRSVRVQLVGWPALLPALPEAVFRITPAALLEWCGSLPHDRMQDKPSEPVDLHIGVDASNPAKALLQAVAGVRPRIDVAGDAAFAADVNWLFDNLRWDIEDDLAALVGPAPARELVRLGSTVAAGLRDAVDAAAAVAARARRGQTA
jgi:ubiquinone biosynthesis protein UbiJ